MTLVANDFTEPEGKLQSDLFPGIDLTTYLTAWIATALAKAAAVESAFEEEAAEKYVYYLAYSHIADRLAGEPNKVSVESAAKVGKDIGKDRIDYFQKLAQKYLDDFQAYLPALTSATRRTTMVQNRSYF